MTRRKFWESTIGISLVSFLSLFVIVPVSPWIARILYPNAYSSALDYMVIANVIGILVIISNFIQPALLKAAPARWQVIKELIYGIIYIGLGVPLLKYFGLTGFCYANLIGIMIKIAIQLCVGNHYCKR